MEDIKNKILEKAAELFECVRRAGKTNYFEINIKYVNGDIISNVGFTDKDKMK